MWIPGTRPHARETIVLFGSAGPALAAIWFARRGEVSSFSRYPAARANASSASRCGRFRFVAVHRKLTVKSACNEFHKPNRVKGGSPYNSATHVNHSLFRVESALGCCSQIARLGAAKT